MATKETTRRQTQFFGGANCDCKPVVDAAFKYPPGTCFVKFFDPEENGDMQPFVGKVQRVLVNSRNPDNILYKVMYEDGDGEDLLGEELKYLVVSGNPDTSDLVALSGKDRCHCVDVHSYRCRFAKASEDYCHLHSKVDPVDRTKTNTDDKKGEPPRDLKDEQKYRLRETAHPVADAKRQRAMADPETAHPIASSKKLCTRLNKPPVNSYVIKSESSVSTGVEDNTEDERKAGLNRDQEMIFRDRAQEQENCHSTPGQQHEQDKEDMLAGDTILCGFGENHNHGGGVAYESPSEKSTMNMDGKASTTTAQPNVEENKSGSMGVKMERKTWDPYDSETPAKRRSSASSSEQWQSISNRLKRLSEGIGAEKDECQTRLDALQRVQKETAANASVEHKQPVSEDDSSQWLKDQLECAQKRAELAERETKLAEKEVRLVSENADLRVGKEKADLRAEFAEKEKELEVKCAKKETELTKRDLELTKRELFATKKETAAASAQMTNKVHSEIERIRKRQSGPATPFQSDWGFPYLNLDHPDN